MSFEAALQLLILLATQNGEFLAQLPGLPSASKVFSDLSDSQALHYQSLQSLQSTVCYTGKCLYEAYAHIPVTYILCTQDEVLPLEFQLERVEVMKARGGKVDVRRLESGHCPNVSRVEETARMMVDAVEGR